MNVNAVVFTDFVLVCLHCLVVPCLIFDVFLFFVHLVFCLFVYCLISSFSDCVAKIVFANCFEQRRKLSRKKNCDSSKLQRKSLQCILNKTNNLCVSSRGCSVHYNHNINTFNRTDYLPFLISTLSSLKMSVSPL